MRTDTRAGRKVLGGVKHPAGAFLGANAMPSGLAISGPTYRSEQFDRDVDGVRELLAARAVYLDAIPQGPS